MADSQSSKTIIEKLGLGFLFPNSKKSDPIATDPVSVEIQPSESSQNAPDRDIDSCEEEELRIKIELEIYRLTIEQAEIEKFDEKNEGFDGEKGENDGVGFEEKDENGVCGEANVDGELAGVAVEKGDGFNAQRKVTYPMRPDAEDCGHYMKYGACKFGPSCKFNHPPKRRNQGVKERLKPWEENSEREGQSECKYYLTPVGCKYGKDCKFSHGSERSSISNVPECNFLGLPIRPGEKECHYYLRTGSCKYGSHCRFHHPDPTAVGGGGDSPSGYTNGGSLHSQIVSPPSVGSWSSPRAYTENSPFVPGIFNQNQRVPTPNPEWNGYQAAATTYPTSERSLPTPPAFAMNNLPTNMNFPMQNRQNMGATTMYPTSERSLPTPPTFAMNNLPTNMNFPMQNRQNMGIDEYPERPGEQECSFFLKTGDCKYKANCKFHHPKNQMPRPKASSYLLNDKGLPLRPDQPICTFYHRYGICKFGPGCKYDHPSTFGSLTPPFDQPPFGELRNVEGPGNSRN